MVCGTEKVKEATDEQVSAAVEVGKLFSEERNRKKLSIHDVAEELRIRQLYLTSIESGRLDELPGYVYIIGFIKSYAQFLNLDHVEILRRLNLNNKQEFSTSPLPHSIPIQQQQSPSLKLLFASLTLLFIFGFSAYIFKHVTVDDTFKSTETKIAEEPLPQTSPEVTATINKEKIVSPLASIEANTTTTSSPEKLPEAASPSFPPITSLEKTSKSVNTITPPKEIAATPPKEDTLSINTEKPTTEIFDKITIIASKDSWVQVQNTKGENIFVRLMHAGETFDVPPTTKDNKFYILNTGNGGGVKFRLNDLETPPLDQDGKVVRGVVLNQAHIKKLLPTPTPPITAPLTKPIERIE